MPSETRASIAIPLSKLKLAGFVGGSTVFSCVGLLFVMYGRSHDAFISLLSYLLGGAGIAVAITLAYCYGRMLLDASPGLVIDADGIFDNASPLAAGKIPWREINTITISRVESPVDTESFLPLPFLIVRVRHPLRYVEVGNRLERMIRRGNYKWFGSPIRLSSLLLKIDFSELERVIQRNFDKYRDA